MTDLSRPSAPASFISHPEELPPVPLRAGPDGAPPAPDEICAMDGGELSEAIHKKQVSCVEVMQAYLARIDRVNPGYNALVALAAPEPLIEQARTCDAELAEGKSRGWMHGMPQAPKDLSPAAGFAFTSGSPLMATLVPANDAEIVSRARQDGAIIIGKSNTPEFGIGSHTFNDVYGATRNALNPALTAGGSSGGAAVALALNLLPVADGSDMMGSLRNPAAFNGVYGFRPSFGRVPQYPAVDAFSQQLGVMGPMGRTPQDCARLLATQAGPHPAVPLSLPGDGSEFNAIAKISADSLDSKPLKGVRIGWLGDLEGYLATEPGLLDIIQNDLKRLEKLGATLTPVALGINPELLWNSWITLRQGINGGKLASLLKDPKTAAKVKPEARWEAENGALATAADFCQASIDRTTWFEAALRLFEKVDFMVLPTAQVFPFDINVRWPREIAGRQMDTYHRWMEVTIPAALAGLPVMSMPVLPDATGAASPPHQMTGYQLIGRPQNDYGVLEIAAKIHASA